MKGAGRRLLGGALSEGELCLSGALAEVNVGDFRRRSISLILGKKERRGS